MTPGSICRSRGCSLTTDYEFGNDARCKKCNESRGQTGSEGVKKNTPRNKIFSFYAKKMEDIQRPEYDNYANWHTVTKSKTIIDIKRLITGCPTWKATPLPHSDWINLNGCKVLDFGCGLGRNAQMLRTHFGCVYGYDLEPMLITLKKMDSTLYDDVSSDLCYLLDQYKMTHIYESVVWQHLKWESGVIQQILKVICQRDHVKSIYMCWNAAVKHQHLVVAHLVQSGWKLKISGELRYDESLANVPHQWYLFTRD
jgi:SAM-dependent methyltransferase